MSAWVLILVFYYVAPPGPASAATQIEMPGKLECYKGLHDFLEVVSHDTEIKSVRGFCLRRDGKDLNDP